MIDIALTAEFSLAAGAVQRAASSERGSPWVPRPDRRSLTRPAAVRRSHSLRVSGVIISGRGGGTRRMPDGRACGRFVSEDAQVRLLYLAMSASRIGGLAGDANPGPLAVSGAAFPLQPGLFVPAR